MKVHRFEVRGLAHYSYALSTQGKAVIIDPQRDIDVYTGYASAHDLRITHILETHIHADFASGARELAEQTAAELWLSGHDQGEDFVYQFSHHRFCDGEALELGEIRIEALHTPGHTPEHISFLVYEKSGCGNPLALFSGDFIFVGSLGRPDLLGEAAKLRLAGELFESVHHKIKDLPDFIEVHPAHGAGSMCGAGMGERPQSTLGYERACNAYFSDREKNAFVQRILANVPEFPEYYKRMKRINAEGPAILHGVPGDRAFPATEFQKEIDDSHAIVIDLRRPEAFGGGHIPGSYNIGGDQNLAMWAAWVVPYERPIYLTGDDSTDYEFARRQLIRVGLDHIRGHLKDGFKSWTVAGLPIDHIPQISVFELEARIQRDHNTVLDVRSPGEWKSGHIAQATHIPGGSLPARAGELDRSRPVNIICGSGYRSSIATSVLRREGFHDVANVIGGMTAWKKAGLPVEN